MAVDLIHETRNRESTAAVRALAAAPRPRLWLMLGALLLLGFASRLAWGYDADELQNLHFAWNIAQGQLPFRDFFEHHPPVFHYALAPFVGGLNLPGWVLLMATRLVALAVAATVVWAFYRLLRRRVGQHAATIGTGALMVTHPFGTTLFELRADWFALAALLAGIGRLADSMSPGRGSVRRAALAGLLVGTGVVLTQKAAILALGLAAWSAAGSLLAPRETRRGRIGVTGAFVIAAAAPPLILSAWFAWEGALGALLVHTVRINLRWASEGTWRYTVNESLPVVLPIGILAFAQLFRAVGNAGAGLRGASLESAVGVLFLAGTAALLTTPVPHGQSYLFLVVPWAVMLGTMALERFVVGPETVREERWYLLAATFTCLAAMSWLAGLAAIIVWSGVLTAMRWRVARAESAARRLAIVGSALLSLGVVVYAGRAADGLRRHEGFAQAAFIEFANDRAPRGAPVLETWPLVTPFRPQPTFHGFARRGPAQTVGVARLEAEYTGALRSGAARFAVVDDMDARRQVPRLASYLDAGCRREPGAPKTRDRLALYDCGRR